jgi:hypothetical protein
LITTAGCLHAQAVPIDAKQLRVGIGELTLYSPNADRKILNVERTIFHENFNKTNFIDDFDIGLIILQTPIEFNVNVKPVCLPETDDFDFEDKTGMVRKFRGKSFNNYRKIFF